MKSLLTCLLLLATPLSADSITLASTTSTQNSGLYDYLIPLFTKDTGIEVKVIAVGTGQALRIARNGDADVLMVHHRPSEDAFMAQGYGSVRFDVMYNDFVLVGPQMPQKPKSLTRFLQIMAQDQTHLFISRGDDSGTHKKERELWAQALDTPPSGTWYREIGAGMGAALNMAASENAYTLSDRGTWLSFGNKGDLAIRWAGDPDLRNPYGLILVNPDRFPHINAQAAAEFAKWITAPRAQAAIEAFRIEGMQLFCPHTPVNATQSAKTCPAQ
ncbi:tungsten ABC transporter substrate-binding protein [Amylibacter marinus]|uniref:Tungsten ABC transporter substrate-binding protein n=1 Tax=Amylibacter marinus TaxID=1475483 RepID=A0ABQ5VTJ2_9RHOB|nr:substrate-binding domain-containing protein [Amylibacter marinus]GLQ34548.1 tungsten ABC transporter substrate-binding protein [Amylibacter marinus]